MIRPAMYQELKCSKDINGNPRGCWLFLDAAGEIIAVEDVDYSGTPAACRGLVQLPTIETYPAERRALLKEWPTLKQAISAPKEEIEPLQCPDPGGPFCGIRCKHSKGVAK